MGHSAEVVVSMADDFMVHSLGGKMSEVLRGYSGAKVFSVDPKRYEEQWTRIPVDCQ